VLLAGLYHPARVSSTKAGRTQAPVAVSPQSPARYWAADTRFELGAHKLKANTIDGKVHPPSILDTFISSASWQSCLNECFLASQPAEAGEKSHFI